MNKTPEVEVIFTHQLADWGKSIRVTVQGPEPRSSLSLRPALIFISQKIITFLNHLSYTHKDIASQ